MRKLITFSLICTLAISLFLTTGCASGSLPLNDPHSPQVEMVRAATRIGLAITLQRNGVSPEKTQQILNELSAIADAVISGEGLGIVLDARWQTVRADVIARVSLVIISYATVDGVPVIDDIGAHSLASAIVDSFAVAIRHLLVKSAPAASLPLG